MSGIDEEFTPDPVEAFRRVFARDRERGSVLPREDYLARFPGAADVIHGVFDAFEPTVGEEMTATWVERVPLLPGPGIPDRIGPYILLDHLGSGGQGLVYLAHDTRLERRVAVKILRDDGLHGLESRARLWREAQALSRVDHPGICAAFDVGEDQGRLYIAMQYVPGIALAQRLRDAFVRSGTMPSVADDTVAEGGVPGATRGPPRPPSLRPSREEVGDAVRIAEEVARALHAAHEEGLVHRDVKPGNIIIRPDGRPVILDFGLAREVTEDGVMTEVAGTRSYMSPEQLASKLTPIDRRTDVFSLGITLYECLTFERPFTGPTEHAIAEAVKGREPPAASAVNPAVSRDLDTVVRTALAKDRNHRYASALALAEDLARVRENRPIAARRPWPWEILWRWAQRNPALAASVFSLLFVLVAGLAITSWLLAERGAALARVSLLEDTLEVRALEDAWPDLGPSDPTLLDDPSPFDAWLHRFDVLERRLPLYRAEVLAAADAGPRETWIRDQLQGLVGRVEDLQIAAARARGWALRAREVRRSSVEDPADAWAAAAVRVAASSRYRDLELSPQLGLLPLGPDQDTGLEEFAVENTGLIPGRDGSGRLVSSPSELIAVVLVLVPGGRARLGAFTDDLDAVSEETRRAITLDPFFIGKWELSQAQWYAMTGHNPARWRSTAVPHGDLSSASGASEARERERWLRPVESVAYHPFVQALRRMGLSIPTEAQWEYAALAGTDSPWWVERERLRDTDNFADGSVDRRRTMYQTEDWDDGHEVTAPVTSMLPNPFGLHHVHGNVSEWTRDAFLDHPGIEDLSSGTGDIVYPPLGARIVVKGGSYTTPARFGRSSARHAMPEGTRSPSLGVRASRPVTP